jgi:hypothetical protein
MAHFCPFLSILGRYGYLGVSIFDHFLDPFLDPFLVETNAFQGAIWHIGGPKRGPKMGQNMTSFLTPFCHPYAESSEKVVILGPLFDPFCHYCKRGYLVLIKLLISRGFVGATLAGLTRPAKG